MAPDMPKEILTSITPAGEILHLVPHAAPALPAVTKRDLEQAWELAQTATSSPHARTIRFAQPETQPLDLRLADTDAASWATAIDRVKNLSTAHGLSVLLRLLALVDLMANAPWLRAWFTLTRAGMDIHPALLQAAALSPLTPTGGFVETALGALLPGGAARME
jgi:hypothetical protein